MRQKVSCNTQINSDLLNEAKSLEIKLSEVFEAASIRAVNKKKVERFKQKDGALKAHNDKVLKMKRFRSQTVSYRDK